MQSDHATWWLRRQWTTAADCKVFKLAPERPQCRITTVYDRKPMSAMKMHYPVRSISPFNALLPLCAIHEVGDTHFAIWLTFCIHRLASTRCAFRTAPYVTVNKLNSQWSKRAYLKLSGGYLRKWFHQTLSSRRNYTTLPRSWHIDSVVNLIFYAYLHVVI